MAATEFTAKQVLEKIAKGESPPPGWGFNPSKNPAVFKIDPKTGEPATRTKDVEPATDTATSSGNATH